MEIVEYIAAALAVIALLSTVVVVLGVAAPDPDELERSGL